MTMSPRQPALPSTGHKRPVTRIAAPSVTRNREMSIATRLGIGARRGVSKAAGKNPGAEIISGTKRARASAWEFAGGSHVDAGRERVLLDELAARLDDVAHQLGEDVVGLVDLLDPHL